MECRERQDTPGWYIEVLIRKGNLNVRLVIGSSKTDGHPHLPAKSYKFIKRLQTVLSYIYHMEILNTMSKSQGYVLGTASGSRKGTFQGQGWGWGSSECPRPAHRSVSSHLFLMTLPNKIRHSDKAPGLSTFTQFVRYGDF